MTKDTKIEQESKWISLAGLKQRGWTAGCVDLFLGPPKHFATNPYYKSAAPMKLYCRSEALDVEGSSSFAKWQKKNANRREKLKSSSLKNAEKRRKQLFKYIEQLEISVPEYSQPQLLEAAIDAYNELWFSRNSDKFASVTSPKSFLQRITVNFLRHECEQYELEIGKMFGQIGKDQGYRLLKFKVLKAIENKYPYLQGACRNQIAIDDL